MTDVVMAPTKAQTDFERAQRALKSFYRVQPNLEAFARIFTKNKKMSILPTSGTSMTDGKSIWLRVDIAMGDEKKHAREVCQKRDAFGQLVCEACLVREGLLVSLFHEIAHVAYDSFEAMSDEDKEKAVEQAVEEAERFGIKGKRLEAIREAFVENPPSTYGEASARVSPYMQPLINGLEDARINVLTMTARQGMKAMFSARTRRIFEKGIETPDGRMVQWRDQPENAQVAVALSCYATGTYEGDWFSDPVAEALRDPELQTLAKAAVEARSAAEVYRLGFPILEKLREHGFCKAEGEPEDEPDPLQTDDAPNEAEPDNEDTGGTDDDEGDRGEEDPDADHDDDPDESDDAADGGEDAASDDEHGDGADGDGTGASDQDDDATDDEEGSGGDDDESDDGDEEDEDADAGDASADGAGDEDEADEDDGDADHPGDEESDEQDPDQAGSGSKESGDGDEEDDADRTSDEDDDDADTDGRDQGTPDDVAAAMTALCSHRTPEHPHVHGEDEEEQPKDDESQAVDQAIVQGRDFDEPSVTVYETRVFEEGGPAMNMARVNALPERYASIQMGERVIQASLGKMRVAFSENRKGSKERNLKSGKVNGKVLGRRVPVDDPRLFQKRRQPGKRDYFVVIGLDVSASTNQGTRIQNIKSAALAQAELLARVGVEFEVWAHTCDVTTRDNHHDDAAYTSWLETQMYPVKTRSDRWDTATKNRLESLVPFQANLDGHTMEFYRKRLDQSQATDKVLMYYTDGDMPYANFHEELHILKRELRECERRGYTVVGVGFQTDSPSRHGLPTVRIDGIEDVPLVVDELRKRLA